MKNKYRKYAIVTASCFYFVTAIIALFTILFPSFALASTYSRTPSDFSNVATGGTAYFEFSLVFDDVNDIDWADWASTTPSVASWQLWIQHLDSNIYNIDCQPYPSGNAIVSSIELPLGEYVVVSARGFESGDCSGDPIASYLPEYADGETIFEVVAETVLPATTTPTFNTGYSDVLFNAYALMMLVFFGFLFYFKRYAT